MIKGHGKETQCNVIRYGMLHDVPQGHHDPK